VLYETHPADRPVAVNLCTDPTSSEPVLLSREPTLAPNGTGTLHVDVTNTDAVVGFQVGTRIDGGAVAWLPTVVGAHTAFDVPVTAGQAETAATGLRWGFVYRYTLAGNGMDCYTGPVFASHPLLIEAVRAVSP
jgi:hypothetical protein